MKLVNGMNIKCSNIVKDSVECRLINSEYSHDAVEVEILEGTWKGNLTVVSIDHIEIVDIVEKQIESNTQTLANMLSENGFDFTVDGFGDSNYITVETFSYRISICVDESGYSVDMINLNRKEYGIYEDESKNHRDIKKAKTVLNYVNKFDK